MDDLNNFEEFLENLPTSSLDEIYEEIRKRELSFNIFPLEVFHPKIKPFINDLVNYFDVPRSYVGLAMLSAYSTAIGTAYQVSTNKKNAIPLTIWACMEGISSSGKSLALDLAYQPLYDIQNEFDQDWTEKIKGLKKEKIQRLTMKTIIYRDAHIPTLVRYIMPDNPKGVAKMSDELMEWLNGMNQLSKKEGTDEQFWLSTWNGKTYSGIRSGKDKFVLNRPFVNVVGGIQPSIVYKLFAKDRDTTGFIFRVLFAVPESHKIASPNQNYVMPQEVEETHEKSIRSLYFGLPVHDQNEDYKNCILTKEAVELHRDWVKERVKAINIMPYIRDQEIHSGILGKIKEYALRFSAILHLSDKALSKQTFLISENITPDVMKRALKLADYFYQSAVDVYQRVSTSIIAPPEVLQLAAMVRAGYTYEKISEKLYQGKRSTTSIWRDVKKLIKEYPKIFNANTK